MNEREIQNQKTILKIINIMWFLFIPFLFGTIMVLRDNPRTSDYVSTLLIVLVVNSVGNFVLSLYSKFLEEQN
jgi:membrane protein YdbS with pleckstrin-like domain